VQFLSFTAPTGTRFVAHEQLSTRPYSDKNITFSKAPHRDPNRNYILFRSVSSQLPRKLASTAHSAIRSITEHRAEERTSRDQANFYENCYPVLFLAGIAHACAGLDGSIHMLFQASRS
jgi:hypothetical protein